MGHYQFLGWSFCHVIGAVVVKGNHIMNAIPADTTLEAARKEFEILRKLGPEVRAMMSIEMSDNLRRIVEAGVRDRHPHFDEKKVEREVLRLMIGDKLYRQMLEDIEPNSRHTCVSTDKNPAK